MNERNKNYSFLPSFIKGESLLAVFSVPTNILSTVSGFIVITQLSVFQYGVYVLVLAFYALLYQFVFKLLNAVVLNDIVRFIAKERYSEAKRLFVDVFLLRSIVAIVLFAGLFLGADFIASIYDKDVGNLFRILSFLLLVDAVRASVMMLFRIELRFDLIATRNLYLQVVRFGLLLIALLFFTLNVQLALLLYVLASFIAFLVLVPSFIKIARPWFNIEQAHKSPLVPMLKSYGKWSIIHQTVGSLSSNVRPWLIKFFISTEAVAIYSVAENLLGLLKLALPASTLSSLIPREIHNRTRATAILLRGTKFSFLFRIALAGVGTLVVPVVIPLLLPQYDTAVPLFVVLVIALPLLAFSSLAKTFLVALRRQRYLFAVGMVEIVGGLGVTVVLLHFFGLWGMVFERIVMAVVVGVFTLGYLLRKEVEPHEIKMLYTFDRADMDLLKKILAAFRAYARAVRTKFVRL